MYHLVVKLNEEDKKKLDFLCSIFNDSMSDCVRTMINENYDNLKGNPELTEIINKLNDFGKDLEKFTGKKLDPFPISKSSK